MPKNSLKIVVFDLDETLGYFVEFGMFTDALNSYYGNEKSNENFNEILDIYPEFLRPNILNILQYVIKKCDDHFCNQIMIYTNNQGGRKWTTKIRDFFEYKLHRKIFGKIISAFKVHGKRVELCRTSHDKSFDDLIRCTKLPENVEVCFLDDQYHPKMEHEKIYYINVKPYTYSLPFNVMAERYYNSKFGKDIENKEDFINKITQFMKRYHYTVINKPEDEQEIDKIVGKKIMYHLKEFFDKNGNKITRKKYKRSKHKKTKKQK